MVTDRNRSKSFHLSAILLYEMKPFNFLHTPTYINFLIFQTIDGWSVCIKLMFGWIYWGFLAQSGIMLETVNSLIVEGETREEVRHIYALSV